MLSKWFINDTSTASQDWRLKGHAVEEVPLVSGLGFLKRAPGGWIGAADPRRDGAAMGQ